MTRRPPPRRQPGHAGFLKAGCFLLFAALTVLPFARDRLLVGLATIAFALALACFVTAYRWGRS